MQKIVAQSRTWKLGCRFGSAEKEIVKVPEDFGDVLGITEKEREPRNVLKPVPFVPKKFTRPD